MQNAGRGLLGCGCLVMLLCGAAVLFFGFHVFLDPRGGISDDEALPGFIGGLACGFLNLFLLAVGAFLAFRKPEGAVDPATGAPGPAAAGGGGGFPFHFATGCGTLLVLVLSCVPLGGAYMFYEDSQRRRRYAEEDRLEELSGRESYGLGSDFWERRADESRNYAGASCCCSALLFLLALGGVGGTVRLYQRSRASAPAA